jgi:hypothetical protein
MNAMMKCGCGETQDVRVVEMTDKLWTEFFSPSGELNSPDRPKTASACPMCIKDWQWYASPLIPVDLSRPSKAKRKPPTAKQLREFGEYVYRCDSDSFQRWLEDQEQERMYG